MKENMFFGASNIIFEKAKQLRNNVTNTEMIIWGKLKEYFPAYKFRRQHPISIYVADIYCHSLKLIIEIDGSIHNEIETKLHDAERQMNLEMMGLSVIRFTNEEIRNNIPEVITTLQTFINKKQIPPSGG